MSRHRLAAVAPVIYERALKDLNYSFAKSKLCKTGFFANGSLVTPTTGHVKTSSNLGVGRTSLLFHGHPLIAILLGQHQQHASWITIIMLTAGWRTVLASSLAGFAWYDALGYARKKCKGKSSHSYTSFTHLAAYTLIARFMWPTWGPTGADRTKVGPMLAPWTLLSG